MKLPGMLLVLTVINLLLVSIVLARGQKAQARNELPVLRGRGLEIVDNDGRVRASITIFPPILNANLPMVNPILRRFCFASSMPTVVRM